jgi:hypothetical protein
MRKLLCASLSIVDQNSAGYFQATIEVIPPGTSVNTYEAYDVLMEVKQEADLLIPLHEPRFAGGALTG